MEKKKVFVIMPFKDEFFEVYEMLKMQFSERFEFNNAGEEGNQQNVLKDIIQPLYEADIVIADLTGLNANVMYELSLAHSFNKKTIIITQDDPFHRGGGRRESVPAGARGPAGPAGVAMKIGAVDRKSVV